MAASPGTLEDYADGASAVEIDEVLASSQPIPGARQRRDSQVGSAYDDDGTGSVSGAIWDGYGAQAIPSSVTSMHHERIIAWGRDRRASTSSRRPRIRRGDSGTSSYIRRRDSGEPDEIEDGGVVIDSDEDVGGAPSDDGRRSNRSRTSLQHRPTSRRTRKPSEPTSKSVLDSLTGIFSRQSLSEEPSSRPNLGTYSSAASDGSRRRPRSRRSASNASAAGSEPDAQEYSDSDEENWGYSSGEEDVASADEISLAPSYLGDGDSLYAHSEGDTRPHSPSNSLPILVGTTDPIFGDTRIDMDVELGYEDFSTQPASGPPSRQRVYLEDEDMDVLFVGCEVITWRKWVWRLLCICSFGILGLAGLWMPTLWLRWVTKEKAFEHLGRKNSAESLVVVEVGITIFSNNVHATNLLPSDTLSRRFHPPSHDCRVPREDGKYFPSLPLKSRYCITSECDARLKDAALFTSNEFYEQSNCNGSLQ